MLRVEDLDRPRTVPHAVDGNLDELRWIGLDWDEGPDVGGPHAPYRQSERADRYAAAIERLSRTGGLFECFLSRKDVAEAASAPHADGAIGAAGAAGGAVYGPRQRAANLRIAPARRAAGRAPSLRYRFDAEQLGFEDRLHGTRTVDVAREVGDVVVRRADGAYAYALAVVVDDAEMGIAEVVRGDDLLAATPAQLLLAAALGVTAPGYLHVPLLLDEHGERLAKRRGDATLRALQDGGADPDTLRGALWASCGLLPAPRPMTPHDLVAAFDLDRLERSARRWTGELESWVRGSRSR